MKQPSTSWAMVALLCATATAGYICRVNVSTAGALMMDEFALTQVDMGRIFSAFILGYALFQIPSGALADRWGARRVLSLAIWLWVAFTVLQAMVGWKGLHIPLASTLVSFVIFRFVMGIVASPTYPASAQGVSKWVLPPFQGRANGIVIASVGLGSALAPPLISTVMVHWGWRMAVLATALPALLMALVWLKVKEPQVQVEVKESNPIEKGKLSTLSFVLLSISYSLQGYVGYIFVSWFYLYLVQERHFSLLGGAWMSSLPWVLSMVSIPLGGVISDRLARGRLGKVWGMRIVPMVGMGASGLLISVGAHTNSAIVAALSLALATAFVLCVEGPFWAMMMNLAGNRSGTAGGVMNMGSNVGGFISPMVTPALAAYMGWENALHLAAVFSMVAALLWVGIRPGRDNFNGQTVND